MPPRIAMTVGDPRGIGPEIVAQVLSDPPPGAEYIVIGPDELIRDLPAEQVPIQGKREKGKGKSGGWDGTFPLSPFPFPPKEAGYITAKQIEKAVSLALSGDVQAIVTGPAEKRALHLAGYEAPGHTEWLGELAGGVETSMMLVTGRLRVVLLTTHVALKDVPGAVTHELIVRKGQMTRKALMDWWGIADPRIAVCALNPHASEGGLFGTEDEEILAPAARELGAAGPLPADTVFVRALNGEFDAVLTPSHDVGMTAVKVAGFGKGVNITLGLPFVRTSPDHGTAFDIAGKGVADPSSMREAVRLAVSLAGRRRLGVG
jgi:4-hydroxythreonine-4-phosphate dehydrogenase